MKQGSDRVDIKGFEASIETEVGRKEIAEKVFKQRKQELVRINLKNALGIFTSKGGLDPYLQEIKDEIKGFTADVMTEAGRKEIAGMAYKVARSKTALDKVGKELVAKLKAQPKLVDAERKRMRDLLDAWRDDVRRPLDEWESAEQARQERIRSKIERMQDTVESDEITTSLGCSSAINEIIKIVIDDTYAEHKAYAQQVKERSLQRLQERKAYYKAAEDEAEKQKGIEKARLRAEQKARDEMIAKQAREEAERKAEAEKQEHIDRENQAMEAKAAAEREAQEAKERAEIAGEQARQDAIAARAKAKADSLRAAEKAKKDERERIAAEQENARIEQEKKEANKQYVSKVLKAAKISLIDKAGLEEPEARLIIDLIRKGLIDNVRISYTHRGQ